MATVTPESNTERPEQTSRTTRVKPRWWRRPWVVPLALVSILFVAYSVMPYLTLDPAQSRVPAPGGSSFYYGLLVGHIFFGAVAILTCCLQVWPWLRQRHPKVHRISGRIYIFAGVLPAGTLGLVIGAVSPFGPVAAASNVMLAALWLIFTVTGWRMARKRRYADHRRWMIRSFALTTSIVVNRFWSPIFGITLWTSLEEQYAGNEEHIMQVIGGMTTWVSWTICLLIAEWWVVERRRSRRSVPQAAETVR